MFPGGIDPDDVRRMQERIDTARPSYETVGEIMQRSDIRRHMVNIAQLNEERERALRGVPLEEVSRHLATVERALNSSGMQRSLEAIRRANELAEARLGSEGLDAAQRVFGYRIRRNTSFEEGFDQASEKIRSGRASEVLDETATLASSDEARQTIERADKEALTDAARPQPEQYDETPPTEIRAGVDVETLIELATKLSEDELRVLEYYAIQGVRLLQLVFSAASVAVNAPLSLTQISHALGGAMALWGAVQAAREEKKRQQEEKKQS